jgi:SnoaL-like domain
MIIHSQQTYDRGATNRIKQTKMHNIEGARALVESFYYAFNQRDIGIFAQVWANHELIQLNNPLGGILRGFEPIANLYQSIFTGSASVWVALSDIVEFQTDDMVVFAGRETGEFTKGKTTVSVAIRTSRIVQWFGEDIGWKQTHHHGSIDDPKILAEYQQAVRG